MRASEEGRAKKEQRGGAVPESRPEADPGRTFPSIHCGTFECTMELMDMLNLSKKERKVAQAKKDIVSVTLRLSSTRARQIEAEIARG